ncbi:MAG: homocysteine S-methyltransferase family protein [Candidatus Delongbacteria bacterium]|nr:homocysteine S-methyltransferase family protein [Candidatus Delongbacteria bacterium]
MMSHKLDELLHQKPVLLDGAWGTELQALGLPGGACPDLWNLTEPAKVESVARRYVEAGSRIILTNTFRANPPALAAYGLEDQMEAINRAGVAISQQAAGQDALVMASIGPSGKMMMMGDITENQLTDAFSRQAKSLAEAGADGIVIETMTDLNEARIALQAALKTGLPVAVSMVYDSGSDRLHTMMGNSLEECVAALEQDGASIIGANCGTGIDGYIPVCRKMKSLTDRPIWIKPNAGLPRIDNGKLVYDVTPDEFAIQAMELFRSGASLIGGCCGTTPEFIRRMNQRFFNNA